MKKRYKHSGYTITGDPSFQDKEYGITPQLKEMFEPLNKKIWKKK